MTGEQIDLKVETRKASNDISLKEKPLAKGATGSVGRGAALTENQDRRGEGIHWWRSRALTQAIATKAKRFGSNVIRYKSVRGPGNNLAILADFNEILKGVFVTPAP